MVSFRPSADFSTTCVLEEIGAIEIAGDALVDRFGGRDGNENFPAFSCQSGKLRRVRAAPPP